jgi:hypothetical protein
MIPKGIEHLSTKDDERRTVLGLLARCNQTRKTVMQTQGKQVRNIFFLADNQLGA